jgi:hypothetical protein
LSLGTNENRDRTGKIGGLWRNSPVDHSANEHSAIRLKSLKGQKRFRFFGNWESNDRTRCGTNRFGPKRIGRGASENDAGTTRRFGSANQRAGIARIGNVDEHQYWAIEIGE